MTQSKVVINYGNKRDVCMGQVLIDKTQRVTEKGRGESEHQDTGSMWSSTLLTHHLTADPTLHHQLQGQHTHATQVFAFCVKAKGKVMRVGGKK